MKKSYKTGEKQREKSKQYYWDHRDEKLAKAKAYRIANAEKLKGYFSRPDILERKRLRRRGEVAADPEKYRQRNESHHLKRYHSITLEQYREMVAAQDGKCAICRREPRGKGHCTKLHVDHDHVTGSRRKLLCAHCNRGIGLFLESPVLLRAAAMYVEHHAANRHTA